MTPQKMIDVIQAYKDGKHIQVKLGTGWTAVDYPSWDFHLLTYRIAPKQSKIYHKYLIKDHSKNHFYESYAFYENIEDAKEDYRGCDITVIKRLDYSKITIEE